MQNKPRPAPPQDIYDTPADEAVERPKRGAKKKSSPERKSSFAANLSAKSRFTADAGVVVAGQTKHGARRKWGPIEYAEAALWMLYPAGPPRGVREKILVKRVNDWLATDLEWCAAGFGPVSFDTIKRAMQKLNSKSHLRQLR
jgi:hypothetical protein